MDYIMVLQYGAMDEILYKDILDRKDVFEFKVSAPDCNKTLYKIRRVHTSTFATRFFEPPFKSIWYKKNLLKTIGNDSYVIFQMAAMIHVGMKTLDAIKENRPNAKMILLLVDSIEAHSYSVRYAKRYIFGFNWDLILSFDKSDCEKYGFTYMGYSYYSKINIENKLEPESDLYYIGANKSGDNRIQILNSVYNKCRNEDVDCDFTLLSPKNIDIEMGIKVVEQGIPYQDIVRKLAATNCILELLQSGQNNQTARYMEAVCYNKKLLTNNRNVVNLPYYNPEYIKVFEKAEDIDINWIKDRSRVEFNYMDDFSPINILRIIDESFSTK